jgi:hypothetical protein
MLALNERQKNIVVLLITLIAIFLREPLYFVQPRIWAEEGSVHIQAVLDHGLIDSIFLPHLGYFSLANNIIVSSGFKLFGLDGIAYFTTFSSLILMLLCISAPLYLKSKFWNDDFKRFTLVFFALLLSYQEIWLNTVNLQFYFCLFGCLLLLSEIDQINGAKFIAVMMLLLVCSMTGVTTVVLTPLYIYKCWKAGWNRKHVSILSILLAGLFIQLLSLTYLSLGDQVTRFSLENLSSFPRGLLRTFASIFTEAPLGLRYILFCGLIYILRKNLFIVRELNSPLLIAVYLAFIFTFVSLQMSGGERYGYAPSVLIFLFMLNIYNSKSHERPFRYFFFLIFFGAMVNFFAITDDGYNHNWTPYSANKTLTDDNGISYIKIFPQGGNRDWRIILNGNSDKY